MEDEVYVCKWKRVEDGFRLWVKGKPQLSVEGHSDVLALSEKLSEKIVESGGAQHAVLEFDRPLPKSAFDARYSDPEIYAVCGDERFEVDCPGQNDEGWFDSYFQRPHCPGCSAQSSPRNEKSLIVKCLRSSFDGGFISCCNTSLYVFSNDFLQHLTHSERDALHLVPLQSVRRSKKTYFELIGPAGPPFRAVATLGISGWRCDLCDYQTFGYWSSKSNIHKFVAKEDLPDPLPDVFTVGSPPDIHLCIAATRWRTMIGTAGTRGMTTSQIGVAPAADIVSQPELLTEREQARLLRRQRRNAT